MRTKNKQIEVEKIDPFKLPNLPIPERSKLPKIGAVYFVISEKDEIEYIGIANNLRQRWYSHGCCAELESPKKNRVAWLELEDASERIYFEWQLVLKYLPKLNAKLKLLKNFPKTFESSTPKGEPSNLTAEIGFKGLKASEVAKKLGVKHVTVRAWLKRGLFPNATLEETILGKVWLIPEKDLENFQKPEKGRPANRKE